MRSINPFLLTIQAFFRTLYPFDFLSAKDRDKTYRIIKELAKLRGMSSKRTNKVALNDEVLSALSNTSGVYFIFENELLRYIGMTKDGLRSRLRRYLYATNSVSDENHLRIHGLINNKTGFLEYYQCPYASWMEAYEIHKHWNTPGLWNKKKITNPRE